MKILEISKELYVAHLNYNSLVDKSYKANVKYENTNLEEHKILWEKASKEYEKYEFEVYRQIIFNVLSKIKPKILNIKTNKKLKWNELFCENYDCLSEDALTSLVGLAENYGLYRLSKEFYK